MKRPFLASGVAAALALLAAVPGCTIHLHLHTYEVHKYPEAKQEKPPPSDDALDPAWVRDALERAMEPAK